ncbi:hypothetical protein BH20ACT2_BH20ACT2_07150 [soil metagenome]
MIPRTPTLPERLVNRAALALARSGDLRAGPAGGDAPQRSGAATRMTRWIAGGGVAERSEATQGDNAGRIADPTRRSFLVRTAVVGSALSVAPLDFVLRPGTAYANVCGDGASCASGWTAFCCTVNNGRNQCPPGSFVAGWWKADNAAFCCGAARYILDCNATCPTQCRCRCADGGCDQRKTCCNQFRYGQCNQQIACFGPVVCRVATCTPPWQYDPACTTASATDNRTVSHSAPCLPGACPSPIEQKYFALGGPSGPLGALVQAERPTPDGRGRFALYSGGAIFSTPATGTHEVHGAIWGRYRDLGAERSGLGYPRSDEQATPDGAIQYHSFEDGRIYHSVATGAHEVRGAIWQRYQLLGGARGPLGLPTVDELDVDRLVFYSTFQNGRIYHSLGTGAHGVHGELWTAFRALGGYRGPLGLPVIDPKAIEGSDVTWAGFVQGRIYASPATGAHGVYGAYWDTYHALGGTRGALGLPTGGVVALPDERGAAQSFVAGRIYSAPETGTHGVHGPIHGRYAEEGGPGGRLGYPVSGIQGSGLTTVRARFERGTITYDRLTGRFTVE